MDLCRNQKVPIDKHRLSCSVSQLSPPPHRVTRSLVNENCKDIISKSSLNVRELVQKFSQSSMVNGKSQTGNLGGKSRASCSFTGSFRPYMETDLDHVERELRRGVSFFDAMGRQSESGNPISRTITTIDEIAGNSERNRRGNFGTSNADHLLRQSDRQGSRNGLDFSGLVTGSCLRSNLPKNLMPDVGSMENDRVCPDRVNPVELSDAEGDRHQLTPPEGDSNHLSGLFSKLILCQKIGEILNFFQNSNLLVVDVDGTGNPALLRKSLADFYNLSYSVKSGHMSDKENSDEVAKVNLTSASALPTTVTPRGQELHAVSTSSSFSMEGLVSSQKTLSFVKFIVKYTDFEIKKDWLDRLLENPRGPEMEELGVYVNRHNLQKKLNQHHADYRKSIRSTSCSPLKFNLCLSKISQKILHPREYRHRKALWHCLTDEYVAKSKSLNRGGPQFGYEIHACPAMLDVSHMTAGSSSKDVSLTSGASEPWDQEKWTAKLPEVKALLASVQAYVQSLEADRTTDRRSLHYHNFVDVAELLSTAKLPEDLPSAESFAEVLIHFAEACYEFWNVGEDARVPLRSEPLANADEDVDYCVPQMIGETAGTDAEWSVQDIVEQAGFYRLGQEIEEELGAIDEIKKAKPLLGRHMSCTKIPEPMPVILESPTGDVDSSMTATERKLSDLTLREMKEFKFSNKIGNAETKSLVGSAESSVCRKSQMKTPAVAKFCYPTFREDSLERMKLNRLILSSHEDTSSLASEFLSVGPAVRSYENVENVENELLETSARNSEDFSVGEDLGRKRSEKIRKLFVADKKVTLKDVSSAQETLDRGLCCRLDGKLICLPEETHADSRLSDITCSKISATQQEKSNHMIMEGLCGILKQQR